MCSDLVWSDDGSCPSDLRFLLLPLPPAPPPPSAPFPPSQVGMWRGLTNKLFDLEAQIMAQASATEKQTVKVKKLKQQVWGNVWTWWWDQ